MCCTGDLKSCRFDSIGRLPVFSQPRFPTAIVKILISRVPVGHVLTALPLARPEPILFFKSRKKPELLREWFYVFCSQTLYPDSFLP